MSQLTLEYLNNQFVLARKAGKVFTDLVVGKEEMEEMQKWACAPAPPFSAGPREDAIPLPKSIKDQIMDSGPAFLSLNIVEIDKPSYLEPFFLEYSNASWADSRTFDSDAKMIDDLQRELKRFNKLVKENKKDESK